MKRMLIHKDGSGYAVVANDIDRKALEQEKTALLARLAEIEKLLV